MTGDNLQPNFIGPQYPTYPHIEELVRVFGQADSNGVYTGFIEQVTAINAVRDRVGCYVIEPNGIALGAGIYDARLVNVYQGLPLYATTCCPTTASSSSSLSSRGG